MNKKITVIGGSGFVGTSLCQKLSDRGVDFEVIDIRPSQRFPDNFKFGDVRDVKSLRDVISGEVVVYLAAVHRDDIRDKREYYRTNVVGADNVATVCIEKGVEKIVFTSTVAVYGFAQPGTDESGKINPFNQYGETKYQAEETLRMYQSSRKIDLIIVRPTVIFGEGNRGNVYNLLKQIASGKFIMVGSGYNKKSMAYIGNVTAFLEACIETRSKYALYNYIDTPDIDMNTLVRQVRKSLKGIDRVGMRLPYFLGLLAGYIFDVVGWLCNRNFPISTIRVKKFCSSTAFDSAKHELDNFLPPYTLKEGLERTLDSEFISPDPTREIFYTE